MSNESKRAIAEAAENAPYGEFSLCKAYGPAFQIASASQGANQNQTAAAPRVIAARARSALEKLSDQADHLLKSLEACRGH